jgi:CheY-like chemotaxis protein
MDRSEGTVLLVEDDANDVMLTARAFEQAGFVNPLQVVPDGEAAIAYLSGEGRYADRQRYPLPILLLLDLNLPRVSGFEVLAWLRAVPDIRRLPVIVLTSSEQSPDINRAYDQGANSYLVKPVGFERLLGLVKTVGLYWIATNHGPAIVATGR